MRELLVFCARLASHPGKEEENPRCSTGCDFLSLCFLSETIKSCKELG